MTKSSNSDQIDPLEILREEAHAAAICYGVERCDELAEQLVVRFIQRLGGAHIYIPRRSAVAKRLKQKDLVEKFDGTNIRELVRLSGYSARHIRRLLQPVSCK